jgi:hypothetical protein
MSDLPTIASYFHPQVVKSILALSLITVVTFIEKVGVLYNAFSMSVLIGVIALQVLYTPQSMISLSLIFFSIVFLVLVIHFTKFQR